MCADNPYITFVQPLNYGIIHYLSPQQVIACQKAGAKLRYFGVLGIDNQKIDWGNQMAEIY
jgi:hypothetical protein